MSVYIMPADCKLLPICCKVPIHNHYACMYVSSQSSLAENQPAKLFIARAGGVMLCPISEVQQLSQICDLLNY